MKHKPLAVGAALTLLATGMAAPAHAQAPIAEPTPAPEAAAAPEADAGIPTPMYRTDFVPFLTPVWSRLVQPAPLGEAQPLFQRYDTAKGLASQAQTSRVAALGFRAEVFAPVIDARVGDIVEVPISVRSGPAWTAVRVFIEYDPAVVRPLAILGVGIPTEDLAFNAEPDPAEIPNADRTVVGFTVLSYPSPQSGPVMRLTFRAVKEGESPLRASLSEYVNSRFELLPNVFRSGLIRVKPR